MNLALFDDHYKEKLRENNIYNTNFLDIVRSKCRRNFLSF